MAGVADKAIASEMGLNRRTVQRHMQHMMMPAGATTRMRPARQAARRGRLWDASARFTLRRRARRPYPSDLPYGGREVCSPGSVARSGSCYGKGKGPAPSSKAVKFW
ncbi:hypothetical protein ACGFYV_13245 [Streptomyces sp. NPDC048297]|uniref:hypothetical protein n=1 Tax=Streptomyces sp. NPDC048297 TaxID=3365531 RepID=UPI00371E6D94